ncbi:MAG: hypothetical protein IJ464_05985 [Alistipes sp.]|nr:hypothetical protein [Alistipes sp.]
MKHVIYSLFALLLCVAVGCETEAPEQKPEEKVPAPTVVLAKGDVAARTLSFTVTLTDAAEAAYMVFEDGTTAPTLETILADGVKLDVATTEAQNVKVEDLTPATSYTIVAAAKNETATEGSNNLYMTTVELGTLTLEVEIVQKDHEQMHFRVQTENAEKIAYVVMPASMKAPEMAYVLQSGEEIAVDNRESVEVADLTCDTEYVLYVAATGNEQETMKSTTFKTDDDPSKIISHEYTRARGTKYGSSCYIMFSYPDATEADNFAYNEKTLCLDIYSDAEKDYLIAGTYEVKESTEPGCVSSYRYSTYGYDNGVQLSSGRVIVDIDPETKAYSFDIDLYLKDGRHLVATYTGDVDNMPVIDIITVDAKFTSAEASSTDGVNWTLNLSDEAGNAAKFDIVNSFKANYIVKNSYTISTSAEEFSTRAVEAGEFNGETSTFTVAGEEAKTMLTGTLHVDIDWDNQKYMLSFYGTLEGNYVIETEFVGAINGISLEPSTEVIEVELNTATARSYEDNANWYLTFTQTVEGVENYRVVLDAFGPASEYLLAGAYATGSPVEGRYLDMDGTTLRVEGEGQYESTEAVANVTIDTENLTYLFDISFRVQDGRTFKLTYAGKVDGMEIVLPEAPADTINWTTFTAKHWYSNNWELVVVDADAQYTILFDLRVADSSVNYIPTGVYTLGVNYVDTAPFIDINSSKFNGSKNVFKDATLTLTYHEDTQTYDVEFDVTHNDDRNFKGTYSGAIEGCPEA